MPTIKIIVVDDHEPWRRYVASALQKRIDLQMIGEAADGIEAVQKARELQPELIVLDIGLPKQNGIEAARKIRECAPKTRILFLSQNRSRDIAEAAMQTGDGYVVKSNAASELSSAVEAVLQGRHFWSTSLSADRPHND
jgi:DNA-binding NarL/FixJ family response regulator